MDDKTLYTKLLGLTPPWRIEDVELKLEAGEVHIKSGTPSAPRRSWGACRSRRGCCDPGSSGTVP
jgi:hypothetical protein